MTLLITKLQLPPLTFINGRNSPRGIIHKIAIPSTNGKPERHDRLVVKLKTTGESSETSIVKTVKEVWDKSEDRVALIGLGFVGVVAFWVSVNLVSAVDKLPIVPSFFELVGILFSAWFAYRYLLYKPDREAFLRSIKSSLSDMLDQ